MSKEKMVTGTVVKTNCEIMCLNIDSAEVIVKNFTVYGKYDNENDLLKTCQHLFETDTLKLVHVSGFSEEEILFGMP